MSLTRRTDRRVHDLVKTVRDFADTVVAPVAAQHDTEHNFPYEVVAGMAEMGLFGLPFPEEYGGMGGDYFALCLAIEELGRVDQSVAVTLEAGVSSARCRSTASAPSSRSGVAAPPDQGTRARRLRPDRGRRRAATPGARGPRRWPTATSG